MAARTWLWSLTLAAAAALCGLYSLTTQSFDTPSTLRVWCSAGIGALGILSVLLFPDFKQRRSVLLAIWLPAVALRLLLLPTAPSDDINRYLWEGKLVASGVSPYAQTADASEVAEHRDVYWEAMNHHNKPTAYPPLSELLFAGIASITYHPMAFKLSFVLADLLTIAGVLWLLQRRGLSLAYSGFYALSPIVLLSYAAEAHFDVLMLAALVWALCAYEAGRSKLAVALIAIATGIKWITLPLLPFFAGKRLISGGAIALGVLLLPAWFFRDSLAELVRGLLEFGGTRSFNGPVYDLLNRGLGLERDVCSWIVLACFAGIVLWRWLWRERFALDSHVRWILGSLILLSSTVHFWYLSWLLPFVCLRPSATWVSLSISSGLYFCVWSNPFWGLTVWQEVLFWLPLALLGTYELWSSRGRCLWPKARGRASSGSISVVVPTFNAAVELPSALASIRSQSSPVNEIVLADAGSEDDTHAIAHSYNAHVVASELGRGQQIAAGIEAAQSEWIVVLHADGELPADGIAQLRRAITAYPCMLGGAFGQRFTSGGAQVLPIEVLNDLRALFSLTAFGDQIQFFHRKSALRDHFMPKQPLMEDVESSWRVREAGEFIYLGQHGKVSARKWQRGNWRKRFSLIIRLVAKYRFMRMRSKAHAESLSNSLYKEYYGSGNK